MIGGGVILCHSLKLGMRRWLVIGDTSGELCGKSDDKGVADRLSKFSENHILIEGQGGFRLGRGCDDQVLVLRSVCVCAYILGISVCKQGILYCVERRIVVEDEKVWCSEKICQCMQ